MILITLLILSVTLVEKSLCSNILIACAIASPSHQIWNYALAEGLMAKGHNVTMVGPDANMHNASEKYHPIVFEEMGEKLTMTIDVEATPDESFLGMMMSFYKYIYFSCEILYGSNGFRQILDYPDDFKFDLILIDVTLGQCVYPLIQKFNYPPTVGITAFLLPPILSFNFGNYLPSSYLPYYQLNYGEDMTFSERVVNFLVTNFDLAFTLTYQMNQLQKLTDEAFGEGTYPLVDLERHVSLVLCNINPALHHPQPLTPNIIPVGGLHARSARQLPKDLQEIMNKSTNGVILMSLGTNLRSDKLEIPKRDALIKAFGQLKQTVLWKFESDFENLPKNVVIRKFLPQNDILAHPNTKLFISHSGGLSTLETAYHGVPILGVPFFADQFLLINHMEKKGLGLKLEFGDLTTQTLLKAINELLQNKKYSENIKQVSNRMKDQQSTPLETAVFWCEYAIRHNGTHYLNPKSRDLPLFVSTSADVILFLLLVFGLFISILAFTIKFFYKLLRRKPKKEKLN